MRVVSNKILKDFAAKHPAANDPLQDWRKIAEATIFTSYSNLRSSFKATDRVGDYYVFDIGGNKYRIVTAIHFNTQMLFIRYVFTHKEYDAWNKLT